MNLDLLIILQIYFHCSGCFTVQVFFLREGHNNDQILMLWKEKNNNKTTKETNKFKKSPKTSQQLK